MKVHDKIEKKIIQLLTNICKQNLEQKIME